MEFKSRFVRALPFLALAASLLLPVSPVAAASNNIAVDASGTASRPPVGAAWAAPTPGTTVGGPTSAADTNALEKPRRRRHLMEAQPLAAASETLHKPGDRKRRHGIEEQPLAAASDTLRKPGDRKRRHLMEEAQPLAAATAALEKPRKRHHLMEEQPLAAASDQELAFREKRKQRPHVA